MPTTVIDTSATPYVQAPETSESLDWADLRTLDLAKYDLPGGKQELAAELTKAIEDVDGYLKSSIHRVVAPPKNQAHIDRLGVLYMVRIEDDCDLVPIDESPVLQKHGLTGNKILGSDGQPSRRVNGSNSGLSRIWERQQRKKATTR
ncbi:hypothetical protein BDW72DRAFT_197280 [Aspergillus terricola var. indicus]